jgi:hypothetical protein
MNEWTVVTVLIAIIGLFFTVGKPVVKLNTSLVTLNARLERMEKESEKESARNEESHKDMQKEIGEHGCAINDHERRIGILEHDTERY